MTIGEILAKSNPVQPQREMSQSEYKKLVDTNTKLIDKMKYQEEEIERLNNIINELENELYKFYAYEGYNDEQIKDKLQELKGVDKE